MLDYNACAKQLFGTVLFRGIHLEDIEGLLRHMKPSIREGRHRPDVDGIHRTFRIVVYAEKTLPAKERPFPYSAHSFAQPGMLMGEVPALSLKDYYLGRTPLEIKEKYPPLDFQIICIEVSPDVLCAPAPPELASAHAQLMRNMMGFLSQKVIDVRRELYLIRNGWDMYGPENRKVPES